MTLEICESLSLFCGSFGRTASASTYEIYFKCNDTLRRAHPFKIGASVYFAMTSFDTTTAASWHCPEDYKVRNAHRMSSVSSQDETVCLRSNLQMRARLALDTWKRDLNKTLQTPTRSRPQGIIGIPWYTVVQLERRALPSKPVVRSLQNI